MFNLLKHTIGAPGWLKLWSIYILTIPFYFFKAGSIQPSDWYIAIILAIYIIRGGLKLKGDLKDVIYKFRNFFLYLLVVNFTLFLARIGISSKGLPWYIISAFYLYNMLVMALTVSLYLRYRTRFLLTTVYSCIFAAILQLVLSNFFQTSGEGVRSALFFTNPNQLGYYSLSSLAIILVLESTLKESRFWTYMSFFLFGYMALLSVSKAALGAMGILLIAYLMANKIISIRNIAFIAVVGGIGSLFFFNSQFGTGIQEAFEIREKGDENKENLGVTEWEYRGYDRIENHPYYLILGAGEGAYNRFDTFIENHEMHSSLGTILFCYGIPGSILFIIFIFYLLRKLPWYFVIYAFPLFSYGVTHMGLRFTIFWIALMMFPIIRYERNEQKRKSLETRKNNHRIAVAKAAAQRAV